jgi:glycosyltransferase involved in cell wall biosynthesis
LRAAISHDWFFQPGGGENVALELARLLPSADVFTSFADAPSRAELGARLHTWPLQRLFGATRRYRALLPLYPLWFSHLDLTRYDVVVSSCSGYAKAVRARPGVPHLAYIHTPLRFAWDRDGYLATSSLPALAKAAARPLHPLLKTWDRRAAQRPTMLVANSAAIRDLIRTAWGRDSEVVHPPVAISDIPVSTRDDGFLLVVSRVLAYRRLDLVVDAARQMGRSLVVAGDGPELPALRARAGSRARFVGFQNRRGVLDLVSRCHAYVVPGNEPFGIAPVEAQAAGKPVVALRAGGALETVIDGRTGVFFERQTVDELVAAIERLDALTFDPAVIRANAERFRPAIFRAKFVELFQRLGVDPTLYDATGALTSAS